MCQSVFGQVSYTFFNLLSFYAMAVVSVFFIKTKKDDLSFWSRRLVCFTSRLNCKAATVVKYVLAFIEMAVFAFVLDYVNTVTNSSFGSLVGTGKNYFGALFAAPIWWFIVSLIITTNPLKQIDIITLVAPIQLMFFKIACFCEGCCWGIPWEHGLYNYHYDHPGKQVPVQAIEAFLALAIFFFLLWYRKRAKVGTVYPMYMTLYSFTRFFSEFFKADYPDIFSPLKTYHILCITGFVVGFVSFFIMRRYGEKISESYDMKIDVKMKRITRKKT